MKALLFAAVLALSFSAHANNNSLIQNDDSCQTGHDSQGNCEDDKTFTCFVQDGTGKVFKADNGGWFTETLTQYKAFKNCRTNSTQPASCRPLGCKSPYN